MPFQFTVELLLDSEDARLLAAQAREPAPELIYRGNRVESILGALASVLEMQAEALDESGATGPAPFPVSLGLHVAGIEQADWYDLRAYAMALAWGWGQRAAPPRVKDAWSAIAVSLKRERERGPRVIDLVVADGVERATVGGSFFTEAKELEAGLATAGYLAASRMLRSLHVNKQGRPVLAIQAAAGPSEDLASESLVAAQGMRPLAVEGRPNAPLWARIITDVLTWRRSILLPG